MRHNQNRRSRGRSRKGPNPLARSYESNGPDVKVRGTAAHVAEKYLSLARDAQAAGDIISAENYLQHAEHYSRIVMAAQLQAQQAQPQFRDAAPGEYDDDHGANGRSRDRFDYNGNGQIGSEDEGDYESGDVQGGRDFRPRHVAADREGRGNRSSYDEDQGPAEDNGGEGVSEGAPAQAHSDTSDSDSPAAPVSRPRRRRSKPPSDNGGEGGGNGPGADEGNGDATQDGAAALAAFPD